MMTDAEVVLVSVKRYAELTGRHEQTIYTAIRYGRFKLPIHRDTGRTIRIEVPASWCAVSRESIETLKHA